MAMSSVESPDDLGHVQLPAEMNFKLKSDENRPSAAAHGGLASLPRGCAGAVNSSVMFDV